jgi:hypothetical protein
MGATCALLPKRRQGVRTAHTPADLGVGFPDVGYLPRRESMLAGAQALSTLPPSYLDVAAPAKE